MRGRRKSIVFFIASGICLVALAVALNVGWILLNWRQVALLVFGIIFFSVIITGLVLNTIFLVREIRRNEQHDAFLNAVTHELKTPIASIHLYLETLQTRPVEEAKRQEFYGVMLADTNRLTTTVEQILRAASVGLKQHGKVHHTPIDISELARECVETARAQYHLDDAALHYTDRFASGAERPQVAGDQSELRAAIANLIDNAVKYSGETIEIRVDVKNMDRRRAIIRVRDKGIGIPREQLKRIFKRFYRVPVPVMTRIKGTGLGLFIVRSIIEKHGGRVFAESDGENRGSTFTIVLPRKKEELATNKHETARIRK